MKLLVITSLLSLSCMVFAADDAKFAEHKKMMIEAISNQITLMQTNKACIEAAANHDAIKKCHETAKAERTKLESQRIDENIKKLEEKKKSLEEKK
jgi:hypothetical protein